MNEQITAQQLIANKGPKLGFSYDELQMQQAANELAANFLRSYVDQARELIELGADAQAVAMSLMTLFVVDGVPQVVLAMIVAQSLVQRAAQPTSLASPATAG